MSGDEMGGSVPDEPSNGELARRLDKIELLLQGLVSRAEYTIDQRHIDRRFVEIMQDLVDLRRVHEDDVKAIRAKLEQDGTAKGSNLRQGIYSGLIPGVFFLISTLVTLLVAFRGGK